MPDYDFRSLSPIDFEILVRDLLQKELEITLDSFTSGSDQGVDLRYVSVLNNQLIIQCKHYASSTFPVLLRVLKNDEKPKIERLQPERYILATSLGLTPARKDKISKLFAPFIQNPSDIYGRENLNNLLARFPEVEKQTFKLWFSGTAVLEEILQTRINNLSRETLAKIQRDAKVYVENGSFKEALEILERFNFCLIVGVPGIGKTMLAEMLLLHYFSLGYDIIKIEGDISEASDVNYIKKRRVFYYDDFLGQTSGSDKLNKNEDQKLLDFISAIKRSGVSKLILTTREYIFNQAKLVYEKLDRTRYNLETCIIDLSKYTRLNRAKILYNHIYFSELTAQHKRSLLADKSYLRIIDHPNYSPRIIEHMTDYSRLVDVEEGDYAAHFVKTLDNPEDLWRHAFLSQLGQPSRDLLLVLLGLPREVFLEDLETAFDAYRQESVRTLGVKLSHADFKRALKELEGTFVSSFRSREKLLIKFQNPSVRDFLENYLGSSGSELRLLVTSAVCFEQMRWLWEHQDSERNYTFRNMIKNSIATEYVHKLFSVLVIPSFGLVNYGGPAIESYKGRYGVSFEDRVALVASVVSEISNKSSANLWEQTLAFFVDRMKSKTVEKDDLVRLLKKMDSMSLVSEEERSRLLSMAKNIFLDIDWLDEYRPLLEFLQSFPDVITAEEQLASSQAFPELARRNILDELVENDPDTLRSYKYEIESIATHLKVDVRELLRDIEYRASDQEEGADEPTDIRRSSKADTNWCPDSEIDSIFNILE